MSRAEVDQCKTPVSSKNTFWDRVRESYINDEDPSYDDVDCDKNHHNAFDDINPSHIVQHTATKLKKMWNEVNGRWKKIVAKFNTSEIFVPFGKERTINPFLPDDH
jgi:hypothetical protein